MPNLISPEITRLAQVKAKQSGADVRLELGRLVVEEALMELDPELDLVMNTSESYSEIEGLAKCVGANDVVINDRHIDVRILGEDGTVAVCRALVGTPYLLNGSLVVKLDGTAGGAVVGVIGPGNYMSVEQQSKENPLVIKFEPAANFDLSTTLQMICNRVPVPFPSTVKTVPNDSELLGFVSNRDSIIAARQKQIVISILTNASVRTTFESVFARANKADRVVSDAAIWAKRVETVVDAVAPKFSSLSTNDVRKVVRHTGELYGGQPQSAQFRKHLLNKLTVEQLSKKFAGLPINKVAEVVDQVFSGASSLDSVKNLVSNKVAVDIAARIKAQRAKAEGFVSATAEEIGMAFNQLALQPAYATHSSGDSGIESINEALQLLEAAELAENAIEFAAD